LEAASEHYQAKIDVVGEEPMHHYERAIMLQSVDAHWREHLAALDYLRQGIHLRGYAQKNPKQEYKREAFELFAAMLDGIKQEVSRTLMSVQIRTEQQVAAAETTPEMANVQYHHADYDEALAAANADQKPQTVRRHGEKVGRNDPCPCGSGKKYKHCHGKLT
jgi:preprotein translocase subunit SecA